MLSSRRNRFANAERFIERAQAVAERAGDYATRRRAAEARFMIFGEATTRAKDAALRWLEIALEHGDRRTEAHAREQLATTFVFDIDGESIARARDEFAAASAIFEELGLEQGLTAVAINSSYVELRVGDFRNAVRRARSALARFEHGGIVRGMVVCKSLLAEAHGARGSGPTSRRCGLVWGHPMAPRPGARGPR